MSFEIDPYISEAELELTELTIKPKRPSVIHSSNGRFHRYLKILGLLAVAVGLFINTNVSVEKELLKGSMDQEFKVEKSAGNNGTSIGDTVADWRYLRWHIDDTVDDNCIHGFRLANTTTLTCGISVEENDISWLKQQHNGVQYCAGVKFEPNSCVEPRIGYWRLPSGDLTQIPPLPRRFGVHNYNDELPRCQTIDEYISDGKNEGRGEFYPPKWVQSANNSSSLIETLAQYDQEYVPSKCSSVPLSPFVWTENSTCQTTVTMYGDSHVRNLFTATIFGLRGIGAFVESHASAERKESGIIYSYEWRLHHNGTADDRFEFYEGTNLKNSTNPVLHCSCDDQEVKRCLRIFFVWAPTMGEQYSKFSLVPWWETDLLIVEPGNGYDRSNTIDENWRLKLDELLDKDKHLRLGILHWTWRNGRSRMRLRTESVNLWVNGSSNADRIAYLRQDAISFEPGLQRKTIFHSACMLSKVNVSNDKIDAAEPCTDRSDYSHIRALTTVLFDAFLSKKNNTDEDVKASSKGIASSSDSKKYILPPSSNNSDVLNWKYESKTGKGAKRVR